jgi:hypothetical protein
MTKPGARLTGIVDVPGAHRHSCHAAPCFGELQSALGVMRAQQGECGRIMSAFHAEGSGDGVGGDIIMGGTDAARGENVIITASQGVECLDNPVLLIGHDADFLQLYAGGGEEFGQVADVLVPGAARQKLVADGECRSGDGTGFAHDLAPQPKGFE